MKLIAGLGNPGKKYGKIKHNTDFTCLDNYMAKNNLSLNQNKFEGLFIKEKITGKDVILLEPQTYMNKSGRSIRQVANFFEIDPSDILIIQDDMDMPIGKTRIRASGKSGGHKRIKSIIRDLGTEKFNHLRIGIHHPENTTVVSWVLTPFNNEQQELMDVVFSTSEDILTDFISGKDAGHSMDKYN